VDAAIRIPIARRQTRWARGTPPDDKAVDVVIYLQGRWGRHPAGGFLAPSTRRVPN